MTTLAALSLIAIPGASAAGESGAAGVGASSAVPGAASANSRVSAPESSERERVAAGMPSSTSATVGARQSRSGILPTAAYVVHGERCASARRAVSHYRRLTYERQAARGGKLADRTPVVAGKTCRWARHAAGTWKARAAAARGALSRWQRTVGQTVARLERGLAGSPMAGTGVLLERHGRRYGISPYFMVAVAATESSIGRAACSNNRRNVWGLASCVNSWPVPYFDSWDEAISFYAAFLASRWPGHSTPYSFRGYAACSECWARKVSHYMGALFGVPAETRYP